MGFNVELQDELGGRIEGVDDPRGLLDKLLPELRDGDDYPFLRSIDPYGDTTFNRLQMPRFLREWATISVKASTSDEQALVLAVALLARRCGDEVHTYLKFIGD
jgi:alkylhydroperoxidase/carboxymuconolactone decarboxylase family protein YurZ